MVIELVLSRPKSGVTDANIRASAQAVAPILNALPGLQRRVVLTDGQGQWIDVIHWDSLTNAQQAMSHVGHRPEVQTLFAQLDEPTVELFHMTSVFGKTQAQGGVTEVALFRTTIPPEAFRTAAEVGWPILAAQSGYVGRELMLDDTGQWADVVQWDSLEAAMSAMTVMEHDPAMQPFMQALDLASIRMFHVQPVDVFMAETIRGS
jgi:hypothetical protein